LIVIDGEICKQFELLVRERKGCAGT